MEFESIDYHDWEPMLCRWWFSNKIVELFGVMKICFNLYIFRGWTVRLGLPAIRSARFIGYIHYGRFVILC